MLKKTIQVFAMAACAAMVSCSGNGWGVDGKIANAPADAKVAVEGLNGGIWYNIDSVEVKSDGTFAYRAETGAEYPDIFRVSLNGKSIYFPIDSLETITITADGKNFDTGYTLAGSDIAIEMMNLDRKIAKAVADKGAEAAVTDSLLKREVAIAINNDQSGVLAYYLINKTIGDKPLFSPDNRSDVRILGAIANKFETNFPDDPRTTYLRNRYLSARKAFNTTETVLEASETGLFDIELYDETGKLQKLSDIAKKSGVTLLNLTSYGIEASPAYNVVLNNLYEKYRGSNLSVYQVSFDADEVMWRGSARNLPWTTVRAVAPKSDEILLKYNVGALPTTFIINSNGDIVDRFQGDPTQLEKLIVKYM